MQSDEAGCRLEGGHSHTEYCAKIDDVRSGKKLAWRQKIIETGLITPLFLSGRLAPILSAPACRLWR
jgi:hypothetical protein